MKKLLVLFLIFSFIGCGSDISCDSSGAKDTVEELMGFKVQSHALNLYGKCKECESNQTN